MFKPEDHQHMARALQLAAQGLYTTTPNPRVGCVIVRDGVVVGEGWHAKAGELHASAPVVAPTIASTASDLNPPIAIPRQAPNVAYNGPATEVSAEEKKKWVRFP